MSASPIGSMRTARSRWDCGPTISLAKRRPLRTSNPIQKTDSRYLRLTRIEVVPPDSAERQLLTAILPTAFSGREDEALAEAHDDGSPVRTSKKEMEALPITIEAMYAFGKAPRTYWIESSREIDKNGVCTAIVFGAGWFVLDSGKFTRIQFDVSVVPCSRESLHYMLPLGVISVPRGQYWIAQWSGWDEEAYDVVEIGARGADPVLVAWGGGC
jgi:hypothetical protein